MLWAIVDYRHQNSTFHLEYIWNSVDGSSPELQKKQQKDPITFPCQGNIRGVFHQGICLDNDHCFIVRRTHSFGQGITGAKPIESSEPNSHCYPRLSVDANQIKWFKIHFLLLDFDWCLIEVTIKLRIICTSIGSLEWIALPPHSSLMKCEAFHLTRGWVERNSFSPWFELRIVSMAHRVTHPLSL